MNAVRNYSVIQRQSRRKEKKKNNNHKGSFLQDQINIHKSLLYGINGSLGKYCNKKQVDDGYVICKTKSKYGNGYGIRFAPSNKVKLASGNVYYNDAIYSRAPQKMDTYYRYDYAMKLNGEGLTLSSTRDNLTMERLHYTRNIADKVGEIYNVTFDEREHVSTIVKQEYNENNSFYRKTTLLMNRALIIEENDKLPIMAVYHKMEDEGKYHIVGRVKQEEIPSLIDDYKKHGYKKKHEIEDCSLEEEILLSENITYLRASIDRIFRITNNRIKTLTKKAKIN